MYKFYKQNLVQPPGRVPLILRTMKLTTLILLTVILQVSANTFAQQVTLSERKAPLVKVFNRISEQTGYDFIVTRELLKQANPVSIQVKNAGLLTVLDKIFESQPFRYQIEEKTVVVSPKSGVQDKVPTTGQARNIQTVTGRVTDTTGVALVGATVTNIQSNARTITNVDGRFALPANPGDVLQVSYIGYAPYRLSVTADILYYDIQLKKTASLLDEVVVSTGYQTLPKERATGSFTLLNRSILNQQVGPNIISRLDGIAAGVLFPKQSLQGGPSNGFMVRGLSTINGPKNPLIVLDNFPYEGNLDNINPNDIENVTILKDAAAASIWGVRAGNGVVVITTRSGKLNQPLKVSFNSTYTIREKPSLRNMDVISSADYIDVERKLFDQGYYDGYLSDNYNYPAVSPVVEILDKARSGSITQTDADNQINAYKNVNLQDEYQRWMYKRQTLQQYALSLQGGTRNASYLFSLGYDKDVNTLDARNDRITLRGQNLFKPVSQVEISTAIQVTRSTSQTGKPEYGTLMTGLWFLPYVQLADKNGNAVPLARNYRQSYIDTAGHSKLLDWRYYPLTDWQHNRTGTALYDILATTGLKYQPFKGLTADVLYRYERQSNNLRTLQDEQSYLARDMVNRFSQVDASGAVTRIVPPGGILILGNDILESHSVRGQFSLDKAFGKHQVNVITGGEIRQARTSGNGSSYYGYDDNTLIYATMDHVNAYPTYINGGYESIPDMSYLTGGVNRYVSLYGNGSYTYDNRYTASVSGRRDASNLFGVATNQKWNPLWSAGLSWNVSNEKFFRVSWLPYLKMRLTYGVSGNVDPSRSGVLTLRYTNGNSPSFLPASRINQFPNPSLRWEKVRMFNLGVDFSLIRSVISGSIEAYTKEGTDLYGEAPFDYTAGLNGRSTITRNIANMKAKGFDVTLNSRNLNGPLQWQTQLMFAYNKDKTTKYYMYDGQLLSGSYVSGGTVINPMEGQPVYNIVGYRWAGLDPQTGDPQGYFDGKVSKDYYNITQNTPLTDLVYKPAIPVYFGNLINTFSWKRLTMSVNISYKFGYYFLKPSVSYGNLFSNGARPGSGDYGRRWQQPGDERSTGVPSVIYPADDFRDALFNNSEYNILKGDQVRLQYINLAYNIAGNTARRLHIESAQVYINAADLGVLWRSNKAGIDPDYVGVPITRGAYTLGLRCNF